MQKKELRLLTNEELINHYENKGFEFSNRNDYSDKYMKNLTESLLKYTSAGYDDAATVYLAKAAARYIDIEAAVINPEMPFEQIRDAVNNQAGIIDFAELDKRDYIILDTETTGLGDADEVVELGITDKYGNVLYDGMFNPGKIMSEQAQEVNGITDNMLKDKPFFATEIDKIVDVLRGRTLVIYNKAFDTRMILQTLNNQKNLVNNYEKYAAFLNDKFKNDTYCVMQSYAEYKHNYKPVKLIEALSDMGINEIQTHRAVGDCIDTAMLISAATLKQYDKADTQLNKMTDATLEDRYTAAMAMLGYEKVIADDDNVSIIFGKSGNEIGFDSWALVGDYLEDISVSDMAVDNYSAYKKLIHPEGRIKYEVLSDKDGNQIFDDFEEALSCYIKIGDTDNKTIKFVNTGNAEKIEIAHKFGNEANNVLNNYYNSIFAKSNLTVNERDKFCIALNISSYKLKRNNIYNILNKAFDELIYSAKSNIVRSNSVDGEWNCIIANDKRPQDYTSINIIGTPIDNKLEVTVAVMHANEVIDAKKISAHVNLTDENSINGLFRSVYDNFKDLICNAPDSLDTDYDSPMISYDNDEIEKFMEKLEEHEYYEIPDLSDIEIKNISEGNPPNDEIIKKRRTR